MYRDLAEHLKNQIQKKIDPLEEQILSGKCSSFDSYKGAVGKRQGLKEAQAEIDEWAKAAEQE